MKRLMIVFVTLAFALTLAACADAGKEEPKAKQEQQSVKAPEAPGTAEPSLQELNSKRIALLLRLDGAESAKKSIEAMILQGQIEVAKIDEQIAKKQPEKK